MKLKCDNFILQELVSKKVYDYYVPIYGEQFLWNYFSENVKQDLDLISKEWRKIHGSGVLINDWFWNGIFKESGYRSNIDSIVLIKTKQGKPYMSGHCFCIAFDLKPQNRKVHEFFEFMLDLIAKNKLKCFKRLEDPKVTIHKGYVHTDGLEQISNDIVFKI